MCECEFEYAVRWPQFHETLLNAADRRAVVAILEERDTSLEDHLTNRCCNGTPACLFAYPLKWNQLVDGLLSGDDEHVKATVGLIEENDRALEQHLGERPCFGSNPATGVTCDFEYQFRWATIFTALLSGDDNRVRAAVGLLEERDRMLELHLKLRVCTGSS